MEFRLPASTTVAANVTGYVRLYVALCELACAGVKAAAPSPVHECKLVVRALSGQFERVMKLTSTEPENTMDHYRFLHAKHWPLHSDGDDESGEAFQRLLALLGADTALCAWLRKQERRYSRR